MLRRTLIFGVIVSWELSLTFASQSEPRPALSAALDILGQSTNPHLREYANILVDSVWATTRIYVCWENPSNTFDREMQLVQAEVNSTWSHNSKLDFIGWQKCATVNKGIRILIDDSGPHTIGLGRQINSLKNGMVLNFTFHNWSPACQATRDYCIKAIAGHEFGHAIGFAHEQNRADAPGECRAIAQGDNGDKLLTPYDPKSIMNYCNPTYNNDGLLSDRDIEALHILYGSRENAGVAAPERTIQFLLSTDSQIAVASTQE